MKRTPLPNGPLVLALETGKNAAEKLASRLRESLAARNAGETDEFKLSLSIGIARCDPEQPCSLDELVARADKLMYEQKQAKRRP